MLVSARTASEKYANRFMIRTILKLNNLFTEINLRITSNRHRIFRMSVPYLHSQAAPYIFYSQPKHYMKIQCSLDYANNQEIFEPVRFVAFALRTHHADYCYYSIHSTWPPIWLPRPPMFPKFRPRYRPKDFPTPLSTTLSLADYRSGRCEVPSNPNSFAR